MQRTWYDPRDLDAGLPVIQELNMARRFKSCCGLSGGENKLRRWLTEFEFVDIATAAASLDWAKVKRIRL